jgi:hypothetical protein
MPTMAAVKANAAARVVNKPALANKSVTGLLVFIVVLHSEQNPLFSSDINFPHFGQFKVFAFSISC